MNRLFLLLTLVSTTSYADIVCKGETAFGPVTVTVSKKEVKVSGAALSKEVRYPNPSWTWDGHMTGLLVAPGLSVSYENLYGCIHNAKITTNFSDAGFIRMIEVAQCGGGTTPDELCFDDR